MRVPVSPHRLHVSIWVKTAPVDCLQGVWLPVFEVILTTTSIAGSEVWPTSRAQLVLTLTNTPCKEINLELIHQALVCDKHRVLNYLSNERNVLKTFMNTLTINKDVLIYGWVSNISYVNNWHSSFSNVSVLCHQNVSLSKQQILQGRRRSLSIILYWSRYNFRAIRTAQKNWKFVFLQHGSILEIIFHSSAEIRWAACGRYISSYFYSLNRMYQLWY